MLRIAHRGASGYEPGNTLSAFQKAIALGVDMVELDVRTCKSGEPIVIHDKFIESKKIKLKDLTLQEIKQLHISDGEKIPTLAEALAVIPNKIKISIDIKDKKATVDVVYIIKQEVKKGRAYENFLITSYDPRILFNLHRLDKRINASFLIFFFPIPFIRLANRFPNTVSVQLKLKDVSQKTVHLAHQFGLQVFAWVANDPEEIERLKAIHVDGIITDFPDRI